MIPQKEQVMQIKSFIMDKAQIERSIRRMRA